MAVVAPIPRASASTAEAVKPGVRRSRRQPNRMSCSSVSMRVSRPQLDEPIRAMVDCQRLRRETGANPGNRAAGSLQRMLRDQVGGDGAAADQVFLDDLLEDRRGGGGGARAFRGDEGKRAALAGPQGGGFCSEDGPP